MAVLVLIVQDKSLMDADPVIWYSFGVTHLPRLEDFPVMPVEMVGFMIKPYGFFMWNPTMVRRPAQQHPYVRSSCSF